MSNNFWGDLNDLENLMNPLDILKEQSGYLMNMTSNIIFSDINTRSSLSNMGEPDKEFCTTFSVMSKMLEQYEFQLFSIYYDITFFPMEVELDENLSDFLKINQWITLETEEEFLKFLELSLNNDHTRRIIKSIYALSK